MFGWCLRQNTVSQIEYEAPVCKILQYGIDRRVQFAATCDQNLRVEIALQHNIRTACITYGPPVNRRIQTQHVAMRFLGIIAKRSFGTAREADDWRLQTSGAQSINNLGYRAHTPSFKFFA